MVMYKITVIDSRELIRTDHSYWGSGVEGIFDTFYQVNMQLGVHIVCPLLRIF